jgi:hypothetical protein
MPLTSVGETGGNTMGSHVASAALAAAFVLAPMVAGYAADPSKPPFTVDNGPVHDTVVDTMLDRTCTGTFVPLWWVHLPHISVQAIFFHKPDSTKWVRFYYNGNGPEDYPVIELGVSAQWIGYSLSKGPGSGMNRTTYAVWPDGDNHLSGTTVSPWGTIDLTCKFEPAWWGK